MARYVGAFRPAERWYTSCRGDGLWCTSTMLSPTQSAGTTSIRSSGRSGRNGSPARNENEPTMSNCVVAGKRLSPMTVAGRKIVTGTPGRSSRTRSSDTFLVRA